MFHLGKLKYIFPTELHLQSNYVDFWNQRKHFKTDTFEENGCGNVKEIELKRFPIFIFLKNTRKRRKEKKTRNMLFFILLLKDLLFQ